MTAVLRVPGTVNRKFTDNLQPVRVMAWGQHTPVERIMAVIDGALASEWLGVFKSLVEDPLGLLL